MLVGIGLKLFLNCFGVCVLVGIVWLVLCGWYCFGVFWIGILYSNKQCLPILMHCLSLIVYMIYTKYEHKFPIIS